MTAWSYCAMAPLNDGSGAKAMKCSQLSKYNFSRTAHDIGDIINVCKTKELLLSYLLVFQTVNCNSFNLIVV